MKNPIILASSSPQRKNLLKLLGLKFSIKPSRAKEVTKITSTCSALVKHNSLLKASDVASQLKRGIVIGSDTVVYLGGKKIILKPKSYREAKKNLKILFSRPQWVYSGVAVIDAKTKKTIVDYEKTKVFMTPLTDREIASYYNKVDPFGKAGGFDIEGWGSVFIRRIEGCYTNVIGLPMAKLAKILKEFGVSILGLFLILNFWGCATQYNLATQREETLIYSEDKEVNLGDRMATKIDKKYEIIGDVDINQRVEEILKKIVSICDRRDIIYHIKIIDEDKMNAVSLPGGHIYIFKGLIDKVENDDQLAGVIAHEVGHITAKHGAKRIQASYGAMALQILSATSGSAASAGTNLAINSLFIEHSQKDEYEADRLSVKYMEKAGYDPKAMITFMEKLKAHQEKEPYRKFSYWKTHPNPAKRIATINQAINGKLEFRDYLNLTENEY